MGNLTLDTKNTRPVLLQITTLTPVKSGRHYAAISLKARLGLDRCLVWKSMDDACNIDWQVLWLIKGGKIWLRLMASASRLQPSAYDGLQ